MSQDIVTARDIMRSLPTVLKKFPFVAKGTPAIFVHRP